MRKKRVLTIGLLLLLFLISWVGLRKFLPSETQPSPVRPADKSHSRALQKLGIRTIGFYKEYTAKPNTFHPAQLAYYAEACTKKGYDLSAHLDQELTFTGYRTDVTHEEESLNVWIINVGSEIVCIYLTVREDSTMAPGIFSINDPFLRFPSKEW